MRDQRTRDRTLRAAAIIGPVLLMILIGWTPGISFTEDLGRHLLLGKVISEQHVVPDTNYLTYTHPDFPFVNHHWLSEVFLYQLHRLVGLNGLIVWKMIMLALALGWAMQAVRPARASASFWLSGILAAVMISFRSHIRPELFTYVFISAYLLLFELLRQGKRWPRCVILVTALLWANLHIYFIFGMGMIFLFAVERWQHDRSWKTARHEAIWFVGTLLASCINPNGLRGFLYPFTIFANYGIGITENASPLDLWASVLNPMLLALPFLSLLTLASIVITWRRHALGGEREPLRLADLLIALTALLAAWKMARSAPLLALAALPVIAATTGNRKSKIVTRTSSPFQVSSFTFPVSYFGLATVAALNIWLCITVIGGSFTRIWPSPIGPTPFGFDQESRFLRLRDLQKHHGLKGPLFSDYNLGSLVEYQLYPEPGYVDNRPEAFPAAFWRTEYMPALALSSDWARIRDERNINAIIVSLPGVKEAYCQELMRRDLWSLVHVDEFCGVWVRNSPSNRKILEHKAFSLADLDAYDRQIGVRIAALENLPFWRRQVETDALIYQLYSLICIGQIQLVWPHLEQLHTRYPDYQIIHELMRVAVPSEGIPIVEKVMEQEARWPVAAKQVLDWGNYLLCRGQLREAESVFKRGRIFFPLSPVLQEAITTAMDLQYRQNRKSM